jgi:hypothetical protein
MLAAILRDQPINDRLMLLHFAMLNEVGQNAVLQKVLSIHGLFAFELRDNTITLLRKLRHVRILAIDDLSEDGLIGRRHRTKHETDRFAEEIGEQAPRADAFSRTRARKEIGALHLSTDCLGRSLEVAAILLEQLGRFGRFILDDLS